MAATATVSTVTAPLTATDDTFDDLVPLEGVAVVDFWAPWCGPCRTFDPVFAGSAQRHPDVVHLKVNVDDNPLVVGAFAVRSIPTLVVLRDGETVATAIGATGQAHLDALISSAR